MKNNIAKMLSALMIAAMLLGFAVVFQVIPAHASSELGTYGVGPENWAYISVDNASFPPPTMHVGDTFLVSVFLYNISGVAGVTFTLSWDPALLNLTVDYNEVWLHTLIPAPLQGTQINDLSPYPDYNNTIGQAYYDFAFEDLSYAEAQGWAPYNTTTLPGLTGALATFNFTILQLPTMAEGNLTCLFNLPLVKIGGLTSSPWDYPEKLIDTTAAIGNPPVPGTYIIFWTAPSTYPYYTVDSFTATSLNQVFSINVYVNDLDPAWEAVGFEFTLEYNSSLLNLMYTTPGTTWLNPYVHDGEFLLNLTAFGVDPVTGLDYAQIGEVVMANASGQWVQPFPYAPSPSTDVVATITFNTSMQAVFPTILTGPFNLINTKVSNDLAQPITQGTSTNGTYAIEPSITGREIDIYTGWPYPYGGQGLDQPSDMFWPQKAVSLFANVTYNGYAEQQKEVAFQIIEPNNTTWAIVYATTDVNGIAEVDFRMPWPCTDPQQYFGVWTVIGTVDIACTIMNDTLWFHYDYLAEIFKQTTTPTTFDHGDYVNVTINYGTYLQNTNATYVDELSGSTMSLSWVYIVVTAEDEVGVPFAFVYMAVPFGGAPRTLIGAPNAVFSNYINSTVTLTLYIPKYAVAGTATIDCAILNDWPSNGGTVQSGYYNPATGLWTAFCPTNIDILAQ